LAHSTYDNKQAYGLDEHGQYRYSDGKYARRATGKKCGKEIAGIWVDGQERGKEIGVCIRRECKIHFPSPQAEARSQSTPAKRMENAKAMIEVQTASDLRHRIADAAIVKVGAFSDIAKIAKKPLMVMVVQLVYHRFDSQVRRKLDEELKLKTSIAKFAEDLSVPQLQALLARMILRNLAMGFTAGGFYSRAERGAYEQLTDLAGLYGVDTKPIVKAAAAVKKEKLDQAQARHAPKVQTSAKAKPRKKSKKAA
jgi:hypothetical protein